MIEIITATLTSHKVKSLKRASDRYKDLPDAGLQVDIAYDFGSSLQEMVEIVGEETAKQMMLESWKQSIRSKARDMMAQGLTGEEIQVDFFDVETGEYKYIPKKQDQRKTERERLAETVKETALGKEEAKAVMLKELDNLFDD